MYPVYWIQISCITRTLNVECFWIFLLLSVNYYCVYAVSVETEETTRFVLAPWGLRIVRVASEFSRFNVICIYPESLAANNTLWSSYISSQSSAAWECLPVIFLLAELAPSQHMLKHSRNIHKAKVSHTLHIVKLPQNGNLRIVGSNHPIPMLCAHNVIHKVHIYCTFKGIPILYRATMAQAFACPIQGQAWGGYESLPNTSPIWNSNGIWWVWMVQVHASSCIPLQPHF